MRMARAIKSMFARRAVTCRGRLMPPPIGVHEASAAFVTRSLRADPPDHAGAGELNQRTIARDLEFGSRIGLTEVSHRAVVGNPGAAVGPEFYVGRTIEPADAAARKRLLEGVVEGEPLDLELKRAVAAVIVPLVAASVEVDELDLVPDFRGGVCRIRRREAEVALERIQ